MSLPPLPRPVARVLFVCLLLGFGLPLTGCASGSLSAPPAPAARELPTLRDAAALPGADAEAMWRFGAALRAAGEPEQGLVWLEDATTADDASSAAWFHLALTLEDLDRPDEAAAALSRYSELEPQDAVRLEGRIRVLQVRAIRQEARAAVAREVEITQVAPAANTVGVMPFTFASSATELQPLSRALAEMLITDLAVTGRLRVVERVRLQAIIDELRLAYSGMADERVAVRSGYLVGAATIVQGRITGDMNELVLDAVSLNVAADSEARIATVAATAARLLDLEKELALEIYASLGVELTAAERARVNERPTENVQAILAWGEGLEASDRGDFAAAAEAFSRAAAIDPGFQAASAQARISSEASQAESTSTEQLAVQVELPSIDLAELGLANVAERDAAAEVTGTEGVGVSTVVEIIIRGGGDR